MKTRYVRFDYSAVREYGPGLVERCEPEDAHYWSVYGRDADGLASCIGDCLTDADAESFTALLNTLNKGG
jgi:hypothetical protein